MINNQRLKTNFLLFLLEIIVFFSFIPVLFCEFTNWDEAALLLENPLVHELNLNNIKQIFTTTILGGYNPLVILSFAFEHHFFQFDPFFIIWIISFYIF